MKISQIVTLKKLLSDRMARLAARKHTHVWNRVIKEAEGYHPKTNKIPPGFKGTANQKYTQAILYKNRISKHMKKNPKKYKVLFRGITDDREFKSFLYAKAGDSVRRKTFSSFTKSWRIARQFALSKERPYYIILEMKNTSNIPSINYTSGKYQSEFAPGGSQITTTTTRRTRDRQSNIKNEEEVLVAPGTFKVLKARTVHINDTICVILTVEYTPYKYISGNYAANLRRMFS